jgi:hypothetical protein
MEGPDPHDEISELEERIEELAESLQRCRKILFLAKISMIVGGTLLFAIMVRLLGFDPLTMIVAITAIIGGIVALGSTTTTAKQTLASMEEAQVLRTELIDRLELRTVREKQQSRGNGLHGDT